MHHHRTEKNNRLICQQKTQAAYFLGNKGAAFDRKGFFSPKTPVSAELSTEIVDNFYTVFTCRARFQKAIYNQSLNK